MEDRSRGWIKRGLAVLLALALAAQGIVAAFAGGGEPPEGEPALEVGKITPTEDLTKLSCRSAILVEQSTGRVLFEQDADQPMAPASITKIMTLLLVFEALDRGDLHLTDQVTCSEHANSMGGSQIWLEIGEQMSVEELLRAVFVGSANDASVALAEQISGTETAFVEQMNKRAEELGMANTHFVNATGLDEAGHVTTARDIAIMAQELMKYPQTTKYSTVWMDSLRDGATELVNTNRLIRFYKGATGLKTGTTDGAGHCLAATATRGELSLIAVTLGSPTSDARFSDAWSLLDYGFDRFQALPIPDLTAELSPVRVLGGVVESLQPVPQPPAYLLVSRDGEKEIHQEVELPEDLEAPVEPGQRIGTVRVTVGEEDMGEYPLLAGDGVEKMTLPRAWRLLWSHLVGAEQ